MRIRSSTFLTSDTHFGHGKLTTNGWGGRPDDFNELIVKNWNAVVGKKDVILHLGDLTMTNREITKKWTSQLRGRKFLILGNHDEATDSYYADLGFTVIPAGYARYRDKYYNYYDFLFTHFPVEKLPEGWFNIHGHTHGNAHRGLVPGDPKKYFDVGVDPMNFTPIRFSDIIDYFLKNNGIEAISR